MDKDFLGDRQVDQSQMQDKRPGEDEQEPVPSAPEADPGHFIINEPDGDPIFVEHV